MGNHHKVAMETELLMLKGLMLDMTEAEREQIKAAKADIEEAMARHSQVASTFALTLVSYEVVKED